VDGSPFVVKGGVGAKVTWRLAVRKTLEMLVRLLTRSAAHHN